MDAAGAGAGAGEEIKDNNGNNGSSHGGSSSFSRQQSQQEQKPQQQQQHEHPQPDTLAPLPQFFSVPSGAPSISPSTSMASLTDDPVAIRRSHSLNLRPPLPPTDERPSARPSAPPTPRDGENSFHRSLSNSLPRPPDVVGQVPSTGPRPCYEAIDESQLLESLYTFQKQRTQQEEQQQKRRTDGSKGPGLNLAAAARMMGPLAGTGRTVRLLGGGLFDLEKGTSGSSKGGKYGGAGSGEGEPMLGVASPFVRLRDGRIVPLRTLNEEQGDFMCLTHCPAPQQEDDPNLRFGRVLPYLKRVMPTFFTQLRRQIWKTAKGIVWFISLIWWQILLGAFFSIVAYEKNHLMNLANQNTDKLHTELKDMHRLFGSVLAFIIAFRTNNAYQSYVEGRRVIGSLMAAIRELTLEVYTALPKGHPGPAMDFASELPTEEPELTREQRRVLDEEEAYLKAAAREVRRLCHLAFAFIRQDVREAHYGFLPGSDLEPVPFTSKNFYLDPCRPRLWDLMSEDELTRYARIPMRARPGCVIGDVKLILEMMALRVENPSFLNIITPNCQKILDCHQAMQRIRDTPVPFPFLFIINLCTFVFVYSTPFLYTHTGMIGVAFCTILLILAYYGLLAVSLQVENPFAFHFGGFNLEINRFSRVCHEDTLQWAMDIAGDTTSFIPAYLVEGATDVPVSAAAAKAAAMEQQQQEQQQGGGDQEPDGMELMSLNKFSSMISRVTTPQELPTPKHLPMPPTPEGLPATAMVAIDEKYQPILVVPPPPTIKQPRQKRWMKIEGQ